MNLSSFETFGEEEKSINTQKVSVSNQIKSSLQYPNIKSDSFNLDMERFSHLTTNDFTPNSRITVSFSVSPSSLLEFSHLVYALFFIPIL